MPHCVDLTEDEEQDELVNIVVDLSWDLPERERKNCEDCRMPERTYQLSINLNNSPQQKEYSFSPTPSEDFHVSNDAPTHGCKKNMEATFNKYINWGRSTLDFMSDRQLTFYEGSNSSLASTNHYHDFDFNSVLEDIQSREHDVRTTPAANNNDNNDNNADSQDNNDNNADSHSEDDYRPLWLF